MTTRNQEINKNKDYKITKPRLIGQSEYNTDCKFAYTYTNKLEREDLRLIPSHYSWAMKIFKISLPSLAIDIKKAWSKTRISYLKLVGGF